MVRITVRVDPPLTVSFSGFFCVFLVQRHCFRHFLIGPNFHICLRSGPRGLTVKYQFLGLPKKTTKTTLRGKISLKKDFEREPADLLHELAAVRLCEVEILPGNSLEKLSSVQVLHYQDHLIKIMIILMMNHNCNHHFLRPSTPLSGSPDENNDNTHNESQLK